MFQIAIDMEIFKQAPSSVYVIDYVTWLEQ